MIERRRCLTFVAMSGALSSTLRIGLAAIAVVISATGSVPSDDK
jgi:hypothetical protein